jgi:hypothetical protein
VSTFWLGSVGALGGTRVQAQHDPSLADESDVDTSPEAAADDNARDPTSAPDADTAEASAESAVADDSLATSLGIGAGMTARDIVLPNERGVTRLRTGLVPALGLQLALRLHGQRFFGGVALAYQSSVGAEASQASVNPQAPTLVTTIQSHHFEAGVTPGIQLGSSRDSALLSLFAGYSVRALASVVELSVPRFSLHGPLARVEFELPLGTSSVVLRLAPEAQLLLAATPALRRVAGIGAHNWALGGEASIRIRITDWATAQLAYRGARAMAPSAFRGAFEDVEHFASLGALFRYF